MCRDGLSTLFATNPLRQTGIALALVVLAGCGFTSLYQQQHGVAAALEQVAIIRPQTPNERELYQLLLQRLDRATGESDAAIMRLEIALTTHSSDLLSRPDTEITRRKLLLRAPMTLFSGEAILMQARPEVSVAYDRSASGYANIRAQEKARQQGLAALATQIQLRLSAFLARRGNAPF